MACSSVLLCRHQWRALGGVASCLRHPLQRCAAGGVGAAAAKLPSAVFSSSATPSAASLPRLALKVDGVPIVHHPLYSAPQLPPGHRFPMGVFQKIYEALLREGVASIQQVFTPASLPDRATLELVHDPAYVQSFLTGTLDDTRLRRIGFGEATRSQTLIDRTLAEVAGTMLTAELALEHGLACNTAGGTHHAFSSHGSGFCIINDLAVTAQSLIQRGKVQRVLILDLDVHQGDGTAAIFEGRDDVFTLSVHGAANFPARKQRSTLDVALPDGTRDADYLSCVGELLPHVLSTFRPDLVLFDAGIDPHQEDALGRLALSDEGLQRREMLVLDTCVAGFGVPVAGYVGGGYHQSLDWLAHRHTFLHRAAAEVWGARHL